MNESPPTVTFNGCVDIAIPVFGEPRAALEATLDARLRQDPPDSQIVVVGSPVPVWIPERIMASGKVQLWRMPEYSDISAARNFAIARSTAGWVGGVHQLRSSARARVAADMFPPSLQTPPRRGVLHADGSPESPAAAYSVAYQWMRFQETKFGDSRCSLPKVVIDQARWLVMRLGRNLVKLRFYFWPIDIAVWLGAIGIAASSFLQDRIRTMAQETPTLNRN